VPELELFYKSVCDGDEIELMVGEEIVEEDCLLSSSEQILPVCWGFAMAFENKSCELVDNVVKLGCDVDTSLLM